LKSPIFKPVLLVLLLSVLITSAGFAIAFWETGHFCYALDDSFIMMALAKNLAFHKVWGLTQYHFSSTASSPFFAVLLAATDWLFGERIWMPLVINLFSLLALFLFTALLCRRWKFQNWQILVMLSGLFVFMPVPVLLFGSMEHILHTLIAFACLALVLEYNYRFSPLVFLLAGAMLASIRFEGLFEGGILILWMWREKNWLKGFSLGLGMLLPVCWLGFYSLDQGWFFLPNSLVLKAYGMNVQETGSLIGFLSSLLSKAANYPHCMAAMLALWLVKEVKKGSQGNQAVWVWVVLLVSVAHFVLARYGHVYRYEAYLMALSWLVVWKVLVQSGLFQEEFQLSGWLKKNQVQAVFLILLVASPLYRSLESYLNGSKAIVNIYEQQVQMARFVQSHYSKQAVGAIDVGAIAYYSDCRLEDLWGLGTLSYAKLKLQGRYRPAEIDSVCREQHLDLVIGYGNPIREPGWVKAESWVIRDNRVCARDTIDFYALTPKSLAELEDKLNRFRPNLPASVRVIRDPKP
jgi:hypothetical protein